MAGVCGLAGDGPGAGAGPAGCGEPGDGFVAVDGAGVDDAGGVVAGVSGGVSGTTGAGTRVSSVLPGRTEL